MKLHTKGGQIKGFDVIFQIHITEKNFVIVKYLKNEKTPKLKKKGQMRDTHIRLTNTVFMLLLLNSQLHLKDFFYPLLEN